MNSPIIFNNDLYAIPKNNQGISLAYANTLRHCCLRHCHGVAGAPRPQRKGRTAGLGRQLRRKACAVDSPCTAVRGSAVRRLPFAAAAAVSAARGSKPTWPPKSGLAGIAAGLNPGCLQRPSQPLRLRTSESIRRTCAICAAKPKRVRKTAPG